MERFESFEQPRIPHNPIEAYEISHSPEKQGEIFRLEPTPRCKYQTESGQCLFNIVNGSEITPSLVTFSGVESNDRRKMCGAINQPNNQLICDQYDSKGKITEIGQVNWTTILPQAINESGTDDIIIVPTEAMKELGEIANSRMKPADKISFVVNTKPAADFY